MEALLIIIPLSMTFALGAVVAFVWASRRGQFDDMKTPAHEMLDLSADRES